MTAALPELVEDWLGIKALGARSGDATNSTVARRGDLDRWARTIAEVRGTPGAPLSLDDLTGDNVMAALLLQRERYSGSTTNRGLGTLRLFCGWLVKRGHLAADPTDDDLLVAPRTYAARSGDAIPYHAFTAAEIERLRHAAATPPASARSAWAVRDVAIVTTLAGCGPRASELCGLQLRHVDLEVERPILRVRLKSKGGKPRDIPMPGRVADALKAWLPERAEVATTNPTAQLFVRRSGKAMDRFDLDRLVRRLAKAAGVSMPLDAATHAFRHHYGERMAVAGVPVPVIQTLMGHTDSATTAIYTRASAKHLVEALEAAGEL